MKSIILSGVVGILIGLLLTYLLDKKQNFVEKTKTVIIRAFWIAFTAYIGSIIALNIKQILWPAIGPVKSFTDLRDALLRLDFNVQLMSIITFAFLAGLLTFAVRFPFLNMEQLKIFGFEYKRVIQQTNQAALEETQYVDDLAILHAGIFEAMSTEDMYDQVMDCFRGHTFDGYAAIDRFLVLIKDAYDSEFSVKLDTGVVPVVQGILAENYMNHLPKTIQRVVDRVHSSGDPEVITKGDVNTFAYPIVIDGFTEPFYIVYMEANSYTFTEKEEKLLNTASNHINLYVKNAAAAQQASTAGTNLGQV